jgi:hypothetical protein
MAEQASPALLQTSPVQQAWPVPPQGAEHWPVASQVPLWHEEPVATHVRVPAVSQQPLLQSEPAQQR